MILYFCKWMENIIIIILLFIIREGGQQDCRNTADERRQHPDLEECGQRTHSRASDPDYR